MYPSAVPDDHEMAQACRKQGFILDQLKQPDSNAND